MGQGMSDNFQVRTSETGTRSGLLCHRSDDKAVNEVSVVTVDSSSWTVEKSEIISVSRQSASKCSLQFSLRTPPPANEVILLLDFCFFEQRLTDVTR